VKEVHGEGRKKKNETEEKKKAKENGRVRRWEHWEV
jgi:hypothetical protein